MSIGLTTFILFAVFGILLFLSCPISVSIVIASIVTAVSSLSWDQITFITREHMCLVLVRDSLSPAGRRILMTVIDVLILLFAVFVITIGGFKLALSAQKVFSALLGIPRSLVYAMAPISGLFIILAQIINIYEDVTGITIEGGNE